MQYRVKTLKKSWLYRRYEISTPEGVFKVEYDGRGCGFETVRAEGRPPVRVPSVAWFAPRFPFQLGSASAVLEVRVAPWLQIKSLSIQVERRLIYQETNALLPPPFHEIPPGPSV